MSKNKKKRIDRAKIVLRYLKAGTTEQEIVFFIKKLFTIKAYVNHHIERLYAKYSAVIDESVYR